MHFLVCSGCHCFRISSAVRAAAACLCLPVVRWKGASITFIRCHRFIYVPVRRVCEFLRGDQTISKQSKGPGGDVCTARWMPAPCLHRPRARRLRDRWPGFASGPSCDAAERLPKCMTLTPQAVALRGGISAIAVCEEIQHGVAKHPLPGSLPRLLSNELSCRSRERVQ